jgi:hypothetical protein
VLSNGLGIPLQSREVEANIWRSRRQLRGAALASGSDPQKCHDHEQRERNHPHLCTPWRVLANAIAAVEMVIFGR